MRNCMLIIIAALVLISCATGGLSAQQSFVKIYDDYNKYLRWGEFDKLGLYVSDSIYDEFRDRVRTSKDVKIVDLRELKMVYDEINGMAVVDVAIDYYYPPSVQVRTVEDKQKWVYTEEEDESIWRLETLLPEFK